MAHSTQVIGLTGLAGSGKSVVSRMFQELDVPVVDTDIIAHTLTQKDGLAIPQLTALFGTDILTSDGALNRFKMRELMLESNNIRQQLEQCLHPLILQVMLREIDEHITHSHHKYILVVVPLLFKAKQYLKYVKRSIFIDCDEDILLKRIVDRDKVTVSQAQALLALQMPRQEQLRLCDDVLYNNGSLTELYAQVNELNEKYTH